MPPLWYVQPAPERGTRPEREGPYTREAILDLWSRGDLSGDVLVWTNEKIFPDPAKPRSGRLVRIVEWRRWVELPDPSRRKLEAAAVERKKASVANEAGKVEASGYDEALDPYSAENYGGGGGSEFMTEGVPVEPPKYVSAVDVGGGGDGSRHRENESEVVAGGSLKHGIREEVTESDVGLDPYGDSNKI